ncbi:MAG: extracellular solute-binding protein [Chloroflexi bacterium]|nr:extracellular solute-binding protein [Chloroflexota bacterium]
MAARKITLLLAFAQIIVVACRPTPQPNITPTPPASPTPQLSPTATPSAGVSITLWAPPEMVPASVLEEFAQAFPQITVDFFPKKAYGAGGIQDFLLTTSQVVPENLPDLVLIDASQIYPLVEQGVLTSVADLTPPGILDDLFPPVVSATTINGEVYGAGVLLFLEHLAYDPQKINNPPADWEEVLAGTRVWAWPLEPREGEVADAFILQYLALGGTVVDRQGEPAISQAVLARTLHFFAQIQSQGLLHPDSLAMDSAEVWRLLAGGDLDLAEISSREVLAAPESQFAFAGLPTGLGNPASIARVWTLAVLTTDPARREAVSQFINWVISEERLASWATATGWLPSLRSTLEMAVAKEGYREFLAAQLETAYTRPAMTQEMARALQQAVEDVLTGIATPQDAASQVAESLAINQ